MKNTIKTILRSIQHIFFSLVLSIRKLFWSLTGANIRIGEGGFIHPCAAFTIQPGQKIRIGKNVRLEKNVRIQGNVTLGDNCNVLANTMLMAYAGSITVGNKTGFNPYCMIYGGGKGIVIGSDVMVAAQTVMISENHVTERTDIAMRKQGLQSKGIVINDDVWVAAGVKILDGVTVQSGCVLAAGAVVTKSTEPYGIYCGVPAKKLKNRKDKA